MTVERADIAIIGAGPAGIAAAISAASRGKSVLVLDEQPDLGGQIWRGSPSGPARAWRDRFLASGARHLPGSTVIGISNGRLLVDADKPFHVEAPRVILAVGARELFLPFPGWTLPGVAGVGGLQALVKAGLDVRGKRIVVAGSGPLLLAVAHGLADHGASVQAIVEQADGAAVRSFALGLWKHPAKLIQAAWLRASLFAVPYWTGAWPVRAEPVSATDPKLGSVILFDGRQELRVPCDLLACGFGLVPNLHLPAILGATIESGVVKTDDLMRTAPSPAASANHPALWCAGEPTGIGGVEVSLLEGQVAGFAAADDEQAARKLLPKLKRAHAFAASLAETFAPRAEVRSLVRHETIVCRCEDVNWSRIKPCTSWRDAKLQTRCGMGPCQGRICGPAVAALTGWPVADARPPAASVSARALLSLLSSSPAHPSPSSPPQPSPEPTHEQV